MFPLVPMPVVFNKIDITPPDRLDIAREKFPDAFEIVALQGIGVDKLLQAAVDEVDLKSAKESIDEYLASLDRS